MDQANRPKRVRRLIVSSCIALAAFCGLGFLGPYRPVEPLPPAIVDMHCHLAGIGANSGCFVSDQLRHSWRFAVYLKSFGLSEKELLAQGDAAVPDGISRTLSKSRYVKKAVVLAMDGVINRNGVLDTNRTAVYVPNQFALEAVKRHTNLLFGASINPYRPDALEQLAWAKGNGAVLVKWLPSIMEIDPGDPSLAPFYRKMVELNLPLLTHCGKERSFSSAQDEFCDPEKLRLPLQLGVRVIAAHIASTGSYSGERSTDRVVRLMREFPNLYADISSLTQLNKLGYMKEALTRSEFEGRLLYGSDFPLINTALVSAAYYPSRLRIGTILSTFRLNNPWDVDVRIKQQLGTPKTVFQAPQRLLAPER